MAVVVANDPNFTEMSSCHFYNSLENKCNEVSDLEFNFSFFVFCVKFVGAKGCSGNKKNPKKFYSVTFSIINSLMTAASKD